MLCWPNAVEKCLVKLSIQIHPKIILVIFLIFPCIPTLTNVVNVENYGQENEN